MMIAFYTLSTIRGTSHTSKQPQIIRSESNGTTQRVQSLIKQSGRTSGYTERKSRSVSFCGTIPGRLIPGRLFHGRLAWRN